LFKPIEPIVLKGKADVFFELYRQRIEYAQALKLNEMFIGILGHDLRNPLGTMLTGAEVLQAQLTDEKQAKTLRRMRSAGRRMTEMIEQLLDLTRARLVGGLGFARSRRRVEVTKLAQRTVDELRLTHPDRQFLVDGNDDCTLVGDPDRLLQLFSNLVANAVQHGEPGTPITVTVRCGPSEVCLRVQNRGAIPESVLPTLFDPFRQRVPVGKKSPGLGLGLFICQQIAQAHGGSVEVASSAEAGTTFTVRIPRSLVGERHLPASGKPRTVLVIEDDEHLRDSLREAFEEEGYVAVTAASGSEALERLAERAHQPDVVILGFVLPVSDGHRICDAMRADPALVHVPIIASTSNPAGAPSGVIVVPKPLILDRLLERVAQLWDQEAS
jgi:two-component system, sensor histidine kinase and response regulator